MISLLLGLTLLFSVLTLTVVGVRRRLCQHAQLIRAMGEVDETQRVLLARLDDLLEFYGYSDDD